MGAARSQRPSSLPPILATWFSRLARVDRFTYKKSPLGHLAKGGFFVYKDQQALGRGDQCLRPLGVPFATR